MKKRFFASLIALCMVIGMLPATALAAGETTVTVDSRVALQAALDNCAPGTTIQLTGNVNYGVVYMRPTPDNPATKEVDWQGNNYGYENYTCFDGLTIKGADGATIDAIEIEGGTYYNSGSHNGNQHSQVEIYPVMLSLVELKNVTIDGVTFTGKGGYDPQGYGNALNFSGNNIKINGLTVKNCVLNNADDNARLMYKTESTSFEHTYTYDGGTYTFKPDQTNITVTGCTFNGGYMGLELRETKNLEISDNTFNGVSSRDILIATNSDYTCSGTVTITRNTSNGASERFVRASGIGNAELTISNNTIVNYKGPDNDFIKVEGVTGTASITGNTFEGIETEAVNKNGVWTVVKPVIPVAKIGDTPYATLADAIGAIAASGEIKVLANIDLTESVVIPAGKTVTLDLNGKTISGTCNASQGYLVMVEYGADLTIRDSSTAQTGKITYAQGESNVGWTIDVEGDLVLKSGTIELTGSWSIGYAVDVRPNAWGTAYTEPTTFTMKGGKILSSDGAVRVASSSDAKHTAVSAAFTMNGGSIDAVWDGVFIQQSDGIYDVLNFTMNGGTIESDLNPIRVYGPAPTGYVNGENCMNIALNDGTCTYTGTETQTWIIDGILRAGGGSTANSVVENGGVTVSADIAANTILTAGYMWAETEAGYKMVADPGYGKEAAVTSGKVTNYYETLADALVYAVDGDTVTLLKDIVTSVPIVIDKPMTLDLKTFNITREGEGTGISVEDIGHDGVVNIKGGGGIYAGLQAIMVLDGIVNIDGGTFGGGREAVFADCNSHVSISNGTFYAVQQDTEVLAVGNATIEVSGGTFLNYNPVNYVANGYVSVADSNDTYTVVKKTVTNPPVYDDDDDDDWYVPVTPPAPTPTVPDAPKVDVDSPTVDTETKTDEITGSTTTTETKQDGTTVETTTNQDGSSSTTASKTETTTNKDGSTTTTTATNTTTETAAGDKVTEEKVEAKVENKDGSTTTTTATNTTTETAAGDKVTESKVEEKVENTDGSTTTTTTTTAETKAADGSTETVKTEEKVVEKDNEITKSTTTEVKNDTKTETTKTEEKTVVNADGTETTTKTTETDTKAANGSTGTTKTDETGKTEAAVKVSSAAVVEAAKAEAPVALPMPALEVSKQEEASATVTVNLPAGTKSADVAIPVAEGTGEGTVAVLINADGTETILTDAVITENGLVANLPNGATVKVVDNSADFDDVADDAWEKAAVDFTSSRNITNGTGGGFNPDMVTSRAMVWTMLARLEGVDTDAGENWWDAGQKWAMENGISDGTNADGEITREQLAVMLYRYMGEPEHDHEIDHFDDHHETSDWALAGKKWAVGNKVINGKDNADGTRSLDPNGKASRAETAQMIMNFIKNVKA